MYRDAAAAASESTAAGQGAATPGFPGGYGAVHWALHGVQRAAALALHPVAGREGIAGAPRAQGLEQRLQTDTLALVDLGIEATQVQLFVCARDDQGQGRR